MSSLRQTLLSSPLATVSNTPSDAPKRAFLPDDEVMVSLYVQQEDSSRAPSRACFPTGVGSRSGSRNCVYGLPWLKGTPARSRCLILKRAASSFSASFCIQDFIYLTGLLVISALSLFSLRAVAGRLWWVRLSTNCLHREIFLWTEKRCSVTAPRACGWTARHFRCRSLAKATRLVILFALWTDSPLFATSRRFVSLLLVACCCIGPMADLLLIFFYGFATYGNAGFMREQVCKHVLCALSERDA
ncbi:MAG: hypothetical protein R3E56_09455 [Burkholderiaceae bacterium]